MSAVESARLLALGGAVLETEGNAVLALRERLDERFAVACRLMLACAGRVVVTGMGKSGHIGGKIAATLASTGTPAFFVHPGEASHGDFGMLTEQDVVLALSNSGETAELLTLLPLIKRLGAPLIALIGVADSTLARAADAALYAGATQEACPLGLTPTASTTAALALGDALAIALLESRGFTAEDFARSHPAGALGRRLLLRIGEIMHRDEAAPRVRADASLGEALLEMTRKGLGMTAVVDDAGRVIGVYTDGDLRRTLDRGLDIRSARVAEAMTRGAQTVSADILAEEALRILERRNINGLLVVDAEQRLIGAVNMLDLLHAKAI